MTKIEDSRVYISYQKVIIPIFGCIQSSRKIHIENIVGQVFAQMFSQSSDQVFGMVSIRNTT